MLSGMAETGKDKQNYMYTRIADLKTGICNIYGVVKFCKAPVKSRGTDFFQVLSITDDSMAGGKLVISLFYSSINDFPSPDVGDVIRFHRLRVESINDALKGRPAPGFSWLLVHEDADNPTTSSLKYTYTDQSKKRMQELQQWAKEQRLTKDPSGPDSLSTLRLTEYCDLVCQVVGTAVEPEGTCFIARVWDGTECPHLTASSGEELKAVDYAVEELAAENTVDVWIYDDHVSSCQAIQPGDFIKLCNLHAALYKGEEVDNSTDAPVLQLILHRGSSYGRRVYILDQDCPEVTAVKERMFQLLSARAAKTSAQEYYEESSEDDTTVYQQPHDQNATEHGTKSTTGTGHVQTEGSEPCAATRSGHHTLTETAQPGCSHWGEKVHHDRDHRKDHHEKDHHEVDERNIIPIQDHCSQVSVTSSTDDVDELSSITCIHKDQGNSNSPVLVSSSSPDNESQATQHNIPDHEMGEHVVHQRSEEGGGDNHGACPGDSSYLDSELAATFTSSDLEKEEQQAPLQSSTDTCMLQTSSVINGHQHIRYSLIRDVLCHEVPSKFRILAHLVDFYPNTVDPWEFVKLFCPKCFFLTKPNREAACKADTDVTVKSMTSTIASKLTGFLGGKFFNWNPDILHTTENSELCPSCKSEGETVALELIYMVKLALQDSSGELLLASLWRDHAVSFFHGVSPKTALKNQEVVNNLVQTLRSLCVGEMHQEIGSSSLPPCLDCCVFSYTTDTGVNFQIFDTVLV